LKNVSSGTGLEVEDLRVSFGGLLALDGVSLCVPEGRITGLIGPNGAGKTTMFNASCGIYAPTSGSVKFDDQSMAKLAPSARARLGLGRSFQQMELFDSLTVWENITLGREGLLAGHNPARQMWSTRAQQRETLSAAEEALLRCGLEDHAAAFVGTLPTGKRRLVEFARCIAGQFSILLLDEPSSGLDPAETNEFGQVICGLVKDRGIGILLVEHDMSLVASVCEYLYVLDFGVLVLEGPAADVLSSPVTRAVYLGQDSIEYNRKTLEKAEATS
jgi:ABC-type branched-subunit amino acid transport system ATPase component